MYFQYWSCERAWYHVEHCKHLTILNIWAFEHFEPGRGVGSIAALSRACGRSPFPPVASWGWRKSNICIFCIFHFSFCIMDFAFASRIWRIFLSFYILHFVCCILHLQEKARFVSHQFGVEAFTLKIPFLQFVSGWKYHIVYLKVAENIVLST